MAAPAEPHQQDVQLIVGSAQEGQGFSQSSSASTWQGVAGAVLPRVITAVFLGVLLAWIFQAEGGLGFEESSLFGFHALLMSAFVVLFTQEALLAYSAPALGPCAPPGSSARRFLHVSMHVGALASGVLGLTAIVYYKALSGPDYAFPMFTLYSPHSWLGVAILCLWALQFFGKAALVALGHALPLSTSAWAQIHSVHSFTGRVIYFGGLAVMAMGFQDMQSSDLAGDGYSPYSSLAIYAAVAPLLLLLLAMAVAFAMKARSPEKHQMH